jgi:hypothetical protein
VGSNDNKNFIVVLQLYMGRKQYKKLWEILHFSYEKMVE